MNIKLVLNILTALSALAVTASIVWASDNKLCLFICFAVVGISFQCTNYFIKSKPGMTIEELRLSAIDLSNQILNFVTDRQRNQPQIDNSNWSESVRRQGAYDTETRNLYATRFGGRVLVLRDEFARHNLKNAELDRFIEHPTNYIGIRTVGTQLGALAHSLPSNKGEK